MRPVALALLALALAPGCGGGDDDGSAQDTGSSTDTGGDTGTEDTGTEDTGTEDTGLNSVTGIASATQPCLWYQGIMNSNSSWGYSWTNSNRVGSRSMSVHSYDATNQMATVRIAESWSQTTGSATFSGEFYETYACNDDGLYLIERTANTTLNITGTPEVDLAETTYDPPAFVRPNAIAVNDSWTAIYKGQTTHTDGTPTQTIDASVTLTATGTSMFPDYQIYDVGGQGVQGIQIEGSAGGTDWWSQGFGIVKHSTIWTGTGYTSGM